MRITGYQIRAALRGFELNRKIASQQFNDSLHFFEGEEKPLPDEFMRRFVDAEERVARLQVLQAQYNLGVTVEVQGRRFTLHEAVKLVSGANRSEKMWRDAAHKKQRRRGYGTDVSLQRKDDDVFAFRAITIDDAAERAKTAGRYAAALKEAIQVGNATSIDFDVPSGLFEESNTKRAS